MCGEREAVMERENPNYGEEDTWNVCAECDDFINRGQGLAMETLLQSSMAKHCGTKKPDPEKLAKKWMEDKDPQFDEVKQTEESNG